MRKRNVQIPFRLSREEAERFDRKVKKSGLTREAYLRHLICGLVPREMPPPDYYSMMKELYNVGKQLNQISRKAHEWDLIDADKYSESIKQFEDVVKRMTEAVVLPDKI